MRFYHGFIFSTVVSFASHVDFYFVILIIRAKEDWTFGKLLLINEFVWNFFWLDAEMVHSRRVW